MGTEKWLKKGSLAGTYDQVVEMYVELAKEVAEHEKQFYFNPHEFVEGWLNRENKRLDGLTPDDYLGGLEGRTIAASALIDELAELFKRTKD